MPKTPPADPPEDLAQAERYQWAERYNRGTVLCGPRPLPLLDCPACLRMDCEHARALLARNAGSGSRGVQAAIRKHFVAALRSDGDIYLLPTLEPLWKRARALNLGDVPDLAREPENERDSCKALDALISWCRQKVAAGGLTPAPEVAPPDSAAAVGQEAPALELIPGGFALRGKPHELTGKPRDMLEALLNALHRRCTALDLRKTLGLDDEAVTYPEQAVRDTARTLRRALKAAIKAARLPDKNPLRHKGRGKDLAYILEMP